MKKVTKEILDFLGNNHTKVQQSKEFKGNYYSYITDTIYIAETYEDKKHEKSAEKIGVRAGKLVMLCHECAHSLQNKYIHILNTILSNLSLVFVLLTIVFKFLKTLSLNITLAGMYVILISGTIRWFLENDAIAESIKLLEKLINNGVVTGVTNKELEESRKYVENNKLKALMFMVKDKIIMFIIILLIYLI